MFSIDGLDSLSAPLRPGPPYQDQSLIKDFVEKEFNNKVILFFGKKKQIKIFVLTYSIELS